MKLITFQSFDAVKSLFEKGYLECDETKINVNKVGKTYSWVIQKMNKLVENKFNTSYPIWCWVKCYNGICPPRRKGNKIIGYDVKITFNKEEKDVFISDFRRYSFLLNNMYIPDNLQDKLSFDSKLKKHNISINDLKAYVRIDKYKEHRSDEAFLNICDEIKESFDKCITKNSDILQGCVWRINIDEIENIEIIPDNGYSYGSINYVRSNGSRFNWIEDFYRTLK